MPTEDQIRELAHTLWEREGRPEGRHLEHFFAAKRMLEEREAVTESAGRKRRGAQANVAPESGKVGAQEVWVSSSAAR